MKIDNIFLIHDWEINKFLRVVLSVQIAVLGLLGIESMGLKIPVLTSLIGFIYLTFIPGTLILRNLQLKNLSSIESLLYTVGLSITTLMFTGFIINLIFPVFGILKPLSPQNILISITFLVVFLSFLSYIRDDGYNRTEYLNIENPKLASFLILIPFFIIIGAYLMNFYNIYLLTLILLVIISLISILSLSRFFKPSLYPLIIFIVSISLLYHNSLISMYIWGWDINLELYLSNLVIQNAYWIPTINTNTNSMLSIVILAPIYSSICNISVEWVFKVIYPFLFSMVPLGLYFIIKKYTHSKIAFLSVFYFMAVYMFYCDLLQLARQQIAEIFFVLLLMLMISNNMEKMKRSILFILFGISLVVSHYGLSYLYMFYVISAVVLLYLINILSLKDFKIVNKLKIRIQDIKRQELNLTLNFALLFVVFGVTWYIYTSNSSLLVTIINLFDHIYVNVFTDLLNPDSVQSLQIITQNQILPFHQFTKYLFLASQFFVLIGLSCIFNKKTKFSIEYRLLSFLTFILLILALMLPGFSSALQTSRFYQITLLIVSPFFVLGIIQSFNIFSKITKLKIRKDNILKFTAIFLSIFLIFNSGVAYKLNNEIDPSMSLIALDKFDYPVFNNKEIAGAKWLKNYHDQNQIYSDIFRNLLLIGYFGNDISLKRFSEYKSPSYSSLIYLGTINVEHNKIAYTGFNESAFGNLYYAQIQNLSQKNNRIYDNQGSQIILVNDKFDPI